MDAKKEFGSQFIKNEYTSQSKFSEIEKTRILFNVRQKEHVISELLVRNGADTDLIIKWKNGISNVGNSGYKVLRNGEAKIEIERLEIENIYLKQLISELKRENDKLRKS